MRAAVKDVPAIAAIRLLVPALIAMIASCSLTAVTAASSWRRICRRSDTSLHRITIGQAIRRDT